MTQYVSTNIGSNNIQTNSTNDRKRFNRDGRKKNQSRYQADHDNRTTVYCCYDCFSFHNSNHPDSIQEISGRICKKGTNYSGTFIIAITCFLMEKYSYVYRLANREEKKIQNIGLRNQKRKKWFRAEDDDAIEIKI